MNQDERNIAALSDRNHIPWSEAEKLYERSREVGHGAAQLERRRCTICGDTEPVHVHAGDERIDDYFTVGRGETDFGAAERWKERALRAEAAAPVLDEQWTDEALAIGEAGVCDDAIASEAVVRDLHAAGYRIGRATPPSTDPEG